MISTSLLSARKYGQRAAKLGDAPRREGTGRRDRRRPHMHYAPFIMESMPPPTESLSSPRRKGRLPMFTPKYYRTKAAEIRQTGQDESSGGIHCASASAASRRLPTTRNGWRTISIKPCTDGEACDRALQHIVRIFQRLYDLVQKTLK